MEEVFQEFFLFCRKVAHVVEGVNVAQVGEHPVSIRHVLVDVVEVGQEQLSPTIELVERLVHARLSHECLVEFADELEWVGHGTLAVLPE